MSSSVTIELLARHRQLLPVLEGWFVEEWPDWYGPRGPGDARRDLESFTVSEELLPVGFVAFLGNTPVGAGALKAQSIPSHAHLSPWAAAGYVIPELRGQGIGGAMLAAMLGYARHLGYSHVYCGTSTANSLLTRSGWGVVDVTQHAGKSLTVFRGAA